MLQSNPIANERKFYFKATDPADPTAANGKTGIAWSGSEIQISKAGGALANFAGSIAEIGATGHYIYTFTTGEIDTPGPLLVIINDAVMQPVSMVFDVERAKFGTVVTGTLTTAAFTTNLTEADNVHRDKLALFVSGALTTQVKKVGAFANTGGLITLATGLLLTAAPSNGDFFQLLDQ